MTNFFRALLGTDQALNGIDQVLADSRGIQSTLRSLETEIGSISRSVAQLASEKATPAPEKSVERATPETPGVCEMKRAHLAGVKLYANRTELIESLAGELTGARIAEIGVLLGDFSEVMLNAFRPKEFVAFDLFDLHLSDHPWAVSHARAFNGKSHLEYYRQRVAGHNVRIEMGFSDKCLARYNDSYFDMIYVDGDHSVKGVKADADVAMNKVKPSGLLVFNDYIMYDWNVGDFYGVVPVVNELVVNHGYRVVGFAFHKNMFCDIAIRRPG